MELIDEQVELRAQTAEAEEISGDKVKPTSKSKFKDEESLLKAYNSLQSEFTKRCQRLKELEGEILKLTQEKTSRKEPKEFETADTFEEKYETVGAKDVQSGEDKRPFNGESTEESGRENTAGMFEFLQSYPAALNVLEEVVSSVTADGAPTKRDFEKAYVAILEDRAAKKEKELTNEDYLMGLIERTAVKERVIREYLSSVKNSNKDSLLLGGGGGIPLTPPLRPKTLAEAGALAEGIFKIK